MGGGVAATWCFPCGFLVLNSAWPEAQPGEQSGLVSSVVMQCPFRLNIRMASLGLLHRGRRIVIPKRTSSRELERFWVSTWFALFSFFSVLFCQFSLSYPCGGNCRLHDLEKGCNMKRSKKGKLLHFTSLFFIWKNPLGLTEGISCLGAVKFGTMRGK